MDQTPPKNTAVEHALIGCLLIDPDLFGIYQDIDVEAFYGEDSRRLFGVLLQNWKKSAAITAEDVAKEYDQGGRLESFHSEYLATIGDSVGTSVNHESYARQLIELNIRRKLIRLSADVQYKVTEGFDSDEIHEMFERGMLELSQAFDNSKAIFTKDATESVFNDITAIQEDRATRARCMYGFQKLDMITGGMSAGDMIVIAGRPSMGKTTFALSIARNVILSQQKKVLFISLEMTPKAITEKLLLSEANIPSVVAHKARAMTDAQWEQLVSACGTLSGAPLIINRAHNMTVSQIRLMATSLKQQGRIDCVMVDYLGLITPSAGDQRKSIYQRTTDLSRSIKEMGMELDVPVVLIAQLNRECAKRKDTRPILSDLRDSGAIEQDADVVVFVHRPGYYSQDPYADRERSEIIVSKNRSGQTGIFDSRFNLPIQKFEDTDRLPEMPYE